MNFRDRRSSCAIVVLIGWVSACPVPSAPSQFGVPCATSIDCDDEQMCRPDPVDGTQRCLPPRQANEAGESCSAPLLVVPVAGPEDNTILDRTITFGAAVDDIDTACGPVDAVDVVLRFTITPRAGDDATVPQGVAIQAPEGAAVELRQAGCDGAAVRFGCAAASTQALVAEVMPGEYDLVVDGSATLLGTTAEVGSRVRVSRIECPTGALPFDETRCLRSTPLTPMLSRRVNHTAHALDDGGIVVAGGRNGGEALTNIEVYSPTLARWQYGDLGLGRAGHGSVIIDDELIAIGGIETNQGRLNFSQVSFRRLSAPRAHARLITAPPGLGRVEVNSTVRATFGTSGRMLVLSSASSETGVYPLAGRLARACSSRFDCGDGEACLAEVDDGGRCVCVSSICDAPRAFVREDVDAILRYDEGLAVIQMGGDVALLAGLPDLPLALVDFGSDAVIRPLDATLQRFAALVAIDDRRVWMIGGEDGNGAAVDWIVEVDVALGTVARRQFLLPQPIARPRAGLLDGRIVIVDDTDVPVVLGLDGATRPAPIVPARRDSRLVAFQDRLVLLGGTDVDGAASNTVQTLELVSRRAPPPPPPTPCLATPLPPDGAISGNTLLDDNSFETTRCSGVFLTSFGRDALYSFSVTEPSSVRVINLELPDAPSGAGYGFRLVRGDCRSGEEVACGDTGDTTLAMFVPEIPAGDYTLVVEYVGFTNQFDEDAPFGGSAFEARVLLGPPQSCPSDERDPLDDTPAGATVFPADVSFAELTGRLCPGDVDTFLFEHYAGSFASIGVIDYPGEALVERVIVDQEASATAGRPVIASTTGTPLSDLDGAPPGFYLMTLASDDDAVDFVQWRVTYAPGCVSNPGDSLIDALDDRQPTRAPTLTPGLELDRSLCTRDDVDLIVLQPGDGFESSVTISDGEDIEIAVFEFTGDGLGDTVPITIEPLGFGDVRVELGVIESPVALRLSVPPSSPVEAELEVDVSYSQRQLGDSCENAIPLADDGARSGSRFFDLLTFGDDHSPNAFCSGSGCCLSYSAAGKDVALEVTLAPGETLEATLLGRGDADVLVYLLNTCPSATARNACVVGRDDGVREEAETLRFTHAGASSAVYTLVLDSYYGEDWSADLSWSITP